MNALVVYASRHGGTAGIAERIAEILRAEDIHCILAKAVDMPDPRALDACVVGSGVYMGNWLNDGTAYLERYASSLAKRPTWLFSSGPLPGSTVATSDGPTDPIELTLGPAEGPGSGGRRRLEGLAAAIGVQEHRVFQGAFDPHDPPRAMSERLVRMMPASKDVLPPGDFREWDLIEAWAREIATRIREPVAVA